MNSHVEATELSTQTKRRIKCDNRNITFCGDFVALGLGELVKIQGILDKELYLGILKNNTK